MVRGKDEDDNGSHPPTLTSGARSEAAASSWFSLGTPTPPSPSCPAQLRGGLLCGAVYVVQEGARHAVHLNQLVWTVNVHRYYSIAYTFTVNNRA